MNGWIKIDRSIQDHWIFQDEWKFHKWLDLLLLVNFQETKVEISGEIFVCKQGETLRSLLTLSNRWKCSRSKARRFLKLLEKDQMIRLKDERKTTRITISNYDRYQFERNTPETPLKQERTQIKKDKKENKKEAFKTDLFKFQDKYKEETLTNFFLYWTEVTPKGKMRYETQKAFSLSRRLITWSKNELRFNAGDQLETYIKQQMNGAK